MRTRGTKRLRTRRRSPPDRLATIGAHAAYERPCPHRPASERLRFASAARGTASSALPRARRGLCSVKLRLPRLAGALNPPDDSTTHSSLELEGDLGRRAGSASGGPIELAWSS